MGWWSNRQTNKGTRLTFSPENLATQPISIRLKWRRTVKISIIILKMNIGLVFITFIKLDTDEKQNIFKKLMQYFIISLLF
jgi:hypothetical protein